MKKSYIYILTNATHTVLYTGVTNDLTRRLQEHAAGFSLFTQRYKVHKLIYFEEFQYIRDAIGREKQIKSWSRARKESLIAVINPLWNDISGTPDSTQDCHVGLRPPRNDD